MDKLKEMFKGKRGKWFLIAAGVVAVVAFIMMRNRSAGGVNLTEYPTYTPNKSGGGAAEGAAVDTETRQMVGELTRDMASALKNQNEQNLKITEQFNSALANTQNSFSQMLGAFAQSSQAQIDGLKSGLNQSLLDMAMANMSKSTQTPVYTADTNVVPFTPKQQETPAPVYYNKPQEGYTQMGDGSYKPNNQTMDGAAGAKGSKTPVWTQQPDGSWKAV